jgi:hypothetical protein
MNSRIKSSGAARIKSQNAAVDSGGASPQSSPIATSVAVKSIMPSWWIKALPAYSASAAPCLRLQ